MFNLQVECVCEQVNIQQWTAETRPNPLHIWHYREATNKLFHAISTCTNISLPLNTSTYLLATNAYYLCPITYSSVTNVYSIDTSVFCKVTGTHSLDSISYLLGISKYSALTIIG